MDTETRERINRLAKTNRWMCPCCGELFNRGDLWCCAWCDHHYEDPLECGNCHSREKKFRLKVIKLNEGQILVKLMHMEALVSDER